MALLSSFNNSVVFCASTLGSSAVIALNMRTGEGISCLRSAELSTCRMRTTCSGIMVWN